MIRVRAALARRPLTIAIVLVLILVFVLRLLPALHGSILSPDGGLDPRAVQQHRWWSLVTSLVVAGSAVQFVVAVAAAVIGLGWAEGLLGWRRTLVAVLVTGLAASVVGVGLELLGVLLREYWSSSVRGVAVLDPLTPIGGAVAWASAASGTLWRRRVRVLLVATASALLLYSGRPDDLYLLVAVLLGWWGGRLTVGPAPRSPGSDHETRNLLALTTAILALGPVLTLLSATRYGVLSPLGIAVTGATGADAPTRLGCVAGHVAVHCVRELSRLPLRGLGPTLMALLPLVLMLVAARGIVAGRRLAVWILAIFAFVEGIVAGTSFGLLPAVGSRWDLPLGPQRYGELSLWLIVSTLVPLGFSVVLVANRRVAPVLPSRSQVVTLLSVVATAFVLPSAVYLAGGLAVAPSFRPRATLGGLLITLPDRLVPAPLLPHRRSELLPVALPAHVLTQLVGVLFWLLVLTAAVLALRGRRGLPVEAAEGERIRELLRAGSSSLGWMATWAGNRLWVSADGRSGIAYRLVDRTAITVSDPFGGIDDPDAVVAGFLAFCDGNAWTPVFYSVHEQWRDVLVRHGWSWVPVAEEAVLEPATFTTSGKKMQDIRTSVNRAARLGVVILWRTWSELPLRISTQIDAVSEEWMSAKNLPALGFTLGGLDELRDEDVLLGVAVDAEQRVLGTTSWLPVHQEGRIRGRTLDFMRRAPESPNGVMEFLIAEAMERFREEDLEFVSLSGSPLAHDRDAAGPLGLLLALVGRVLEPLYGFRSLLRFKRKFGVRVESLTLCYADPVELPRIGLDIARAYLPGLTLRQVRRLLRPRAG